MIRWQLSGEWTNCAWSSDGSKAALFSDDRHGIMIWDASSWSSETNSAEDLVTYSLNGHTKPVTSVRWAADNVTLISGSTDGTMRVWDCAKPNTGRETMPGHGNGAKPRGVTVSSDGTRALTTADDSLCLWDTQTGALVGRHTVPRGLKLANTAVLSPDGQRAFLMGLRSEGVRKRGLVPFAESGRSDWKEIVTACVVDDVDLDDDEPEMVGGGSSGNATAEREIQYAPIDEQAYERWGREDLGRNEDTAVWQAEGEAVFFTKFDQDNYYVQCWTADAATAKATMSIAIYCSNMTATTDLKLGITTDGTTDAQPGLDSFMGWSERVPSGDGPGYRNAIAAVSPGNQLMAHAYCNELTIRDVATGKTVGRVCLSDMTTIENTAADEQDNGASDNEGEGESR